MPELQQLAVFSIEEQRYALPLAAVERIIRAVALTPLPKAPDTVLGVVDVHGTVLPVLSLRRRFRLAEREISTDDHFLIARTEKRRVVLVIDRAEEVIETPLGEIDRIPQVGAAIDQLSGVVKLPDGLVLIHDVENFLSLEEECRLDQALSEENGTDGS